MSSAGAASSDHALLVGTGSTIHPNAVLDVTTGPITLGQRCKIHLGALLMPCGGSIVMGDDCTVNPYSVLYGHGGLRMGNGVRVATHTVIVPANHRFDDTSRPIHRQGLKRKGIIIGDDVWIGCNVSILDGVRIGTGVVVAAGAVVIRDVPDHLVVGGTPAGVIRSRR